MSDRPHLIVVIADTLRQDYLGCYGNDRIQTPHLDAFARDAVCFTGASPEALPTVLYRRAFHTGRRVFPVREWRPVKWDIVNLPGWQPLDNDEDTLAENLAANGYYTGFVTDSLIYFSPGMNFTRGFWQWEFVRGMQQDRWRSPAAVSREHLSRYGDPDTFLAGFPGNLVLRHAANTAHIRSEEETPTAQVFQWAMNFVEDNRRVAPFYLFVDSFAPHEPWEAPAAYLARYADPGYRGRTIVHARYGPMDGQMTPDELEQVKAHYSGLVSLVDAGFGRFIERLKELGLYDNAVIVVTSDHGTNFADNPERIVGKPASAMYPGVMRVPLLIRFPSGQGSGRRVDDLVSNVDIAATLYAQSGVWDRMGEALALDGRDLSPLALEDDGHGRSYLTCRYGNELWYRDDRYWVLLDLDGNARAVFDLERDPGCQRNVAADEPDVVERAWRRLLEDAGGHLPDYRERLTTDAIGQRPQRR